jgi:hypothetical protein
LNRYSYCINNPLIYTDPSGYYWWNDLWNWFTGNNQDNTNTSNAIQLEEITVTAEKPKTSVFAYSTTEGIVGTEGKQQSDFDFNEWINSPEGKEASEKLTNEILGMLPIGGIAKVEQVASKGVIIIGENMGAVKKAAQALRAKGINAKWYQAWKKNIPGDRLMTPSELNAAKARNARWIEGKITEGYEIYDIGIDASRATRSPFYELEQSILQNYGYPTIPLPR